MCRFNSLKSCKETFSVPSEKAAFFFCYAARLLSIFIFKISLVFSIPTEISKKQKKTDFFSQFS